MAAFTVGTEPSNINTYERLAVWAAQVLQDLAGVQEVIPVQGEQAVPRCQVSTAKLADGREHFIVQLYVPYDPAELNSPTEKTWMAATDISNSTPHVNLTSN